MPFTITETFKNSANLIPVVGVDAEAEDGVDFDGLLAAHGGTKFPGGECRHNLGGHGGGAGFEDLQIFQIAGSIQRALDYEARVREVSGEIGAQALRAND
jgi:hypothetical protein